VSFDARTALYTLAGIFAVLGVALRLLPAQVDTPSAPPVTVASLQPGPSASEQAEALLSYQEIVRANPFSAERQPPESRYVPPDLVQEPAEQPTARPAPRRAPRLFGVAVGPDGAVALIDADPAIPGAEVYRPGDLVGTARLVEVRDTAVVLDGPDGRQVLTLPSSSRRTP